MALYAEQVYRRQLVRPTRGVALVQSTEPWQVPTAAEVVKAGSNRLAMKSKGMQPHKTIREAVGLIVVRSSDFSFF